MKIVTKEQFNHFLSDKWYTVHPGFFKNSKRYIIDGEYAAYKDEEIFKIKE